MQWLIDLFMDYPILWLIALGAVGQALSPNPKKAREKAQRRRAEERGEMSSDKDSFLGQARKPDPPAPSSADREDEVARQIRDMLSAGGSSSPSPEPKMVIYSEPEPIRQVMPAAPPPPMPAEPTVRPSTKRARPGRQDRDREHIGEAFAAFDTGFAERDRQHEARGSKKRVALAKDLRADSRMGEKLTLGDLSLGDLAPATTLPGAKAPRRRATLQGLDVKQAVRAMLILGPPRSMADLERDTLSPWAYREGSKIPLWLLDD